MDKESEGGEGNEEGSKGLTYRVFGQGRIRNGAGTAYSSPVYTGHSELILHLIHQPIHHKFRI